MNSLKSRKADLKDLDALLHLEEMNFTITGERFNRRQIRYLLQSPHTVVEVLEDAGTVIGWAVGLLKKTKNTCSGRVYGVVVDAGYRGRKLGERLALTIIDQLKMRGAVRIYLEVREDNHAAINLYHKLGFADHGPLRDYYGNNVHGLRMCKSL